MSSHHQQSCKCAGFKLTRNCGLTNWCYKVLNLPLEIEIDIDIDIDIEKNRN